MAIADVKEFVHLSEEDVKKLGEEFDAIRKEIEDSRGGNDAAYIRRMIMVHRGLLIAGRVTLFASGVKVKGGWRPAWVAGAALLGVAKILENMEIGHNVMHGQWDWMNDPEIHSSTLLWECFHCSATTTTSGTAFSGWRVSRSGAPSTSVSRSTTPSWPRSSSGASGCTTSTSGRSARARRTRR